MEQSLNTFIKEGFPQIRVFPTYFEVKQWPEQAYHVYNFKEVEKLDYLDPIDTLWGKITLLLTPSSLLHTRNHQHLTITLRNGRIVNYTTPLKFEPSFAEIVQIVRDRLQ